MRKGYIIFGLIFAIIGIVAIKWNDLYTLGFIVLIIGAITIMIGIASNKKEEVKMEEETVKDEKEDSEKKEE